MNASCGDKKTKGNEIQQEYRSSLTEMAPLFSSFHGNDAGKPGLTSNRVALHEQFTVSPQRFAQLSAPCRPSADPCSYSEEECHRLSTSHMPVAPTSTKAQHFASFFGTMDGTTVCDSKSTGSNTLLDTVAMTTKGDKLKNIAAKTADAQLPSTLDKAESNDGQPVCDTPATDVTKLVKGAQYLSIRDGLQSVSDSRQTDLASQSEGYAIVGCENAGDSGKVIAEDEVLLTVSKPYQDTSCKEHGKTTVGAFPNECCSDTNKIKKVSQSKGSDAEEVPFDRPISIDVGVPGPCSAEEHTVIMEDDLEHCRENLPDARCTCDSMVESSSKIEVETALPCRDTEVSPKPTKGLSSILDTNNREIAGNASNDTPCFSGRNKCGACGESANKNSCHCGVAESSQEDIDMGNSSNDSESRFALSLSPKAVIQEIGQLRFWKARLALIRQQRIFSDQVFELHKLIEVQRLLAGTPHTSIDEIYFGVGNMNLECDADAFASNNYLVDKNENVGDALGKQILVSKQAVEFPTVAGETKTKPVNSQAHLEESLAVPGSEEDGVSAWGYSSLGVRHVTGSLPASGACPYPPFGGPFAAPRVGLAGAPVIQSPTFPFSFPVTYRSAIASAHRQQSTSYHNSSSGLEVSNHSGQKRLNKTCGAAEGPTPSIATISRQPDTPQQRVKVEYPYSCNSQRYLHEEGVQPGRQGVTMAGSKSEDLQHILMGLKFKSSTAMPGNDLWEHSEHNEQGCSKALDMKHYDSIAKKESLFKEVRGCKRQEERKQQDSLTTAELVDVNNSVNLSLGPLRLFPLAPTQSLDEQIKRRSSGGGKEWQGHVIKVVPRAVKSTSESAAGILLSIQQERKPQL